MTKNKKLIENPINEDYLYKSDEEKIRNIQFHFKEIIKHLGLNLNNDSIVGTPQRVAKMYVEEIFYGLNKKNKPSNKVFENKFKYNQMIVEKDIAVKSICEHHFVPIIGKAQVAYISNGKIIGLSKINRIVNYFSRRPQVQERLTIQISEEIKEMLNTEDVAVLVEAKHFCVSLRGIKDDVSTTTTAEYSGQFKKKDVKREFLSYITKKLNF